MEARVDVDSLGFGDGVEVVDVEGVVSTGGGLDAEGDGEDPVGPVGTALEAAFESPSSSSCLR